MKKWKSILLLLLVFSAGLAVGVVGTRVVVRRAVQHAMMNPERVELVMERNLTRRLQLDNDQQAKLHTVLTDTRAQLTDLRKQYQPQAAEIWRGAGTKISAFLTSEQQAKFSKIKEQGWPALRRLRAGTTP